MLVESWEESLVSPEVRYSRKPKDGPKKDGFWVLDSSDGQVTG